MRALPLFHRLAGTPVIVVGAGPEAEAKRRLVRRAGGEVIADLADGIERGARLAFVASETAEADAERLRAHGLLVNVVDRPELCDFTVPSLLDRDPVLIAVGTAGASAGLAKQIRLRLEQLLPASLGALAQGLEGARGALRACFPDAAGRRRALDEALRPGGALDPLNEGGAERVAKWLANPASGATAATIELNLTSDDPEDLTLRQARLLGTADALLCEPVIGAAILDRARADALRFTLPYDGPPLSGVVLVLRRARSAGDYNHLT